LTGSATTVPATCAATTVWRTASTVPSWLAGRCSVAEETVQVARASAAPAGTGVKAVAIEKAAAARALNLRDMWTPGVTS
jgi:hypothetical protein